MKEKHHFTFTKKDRERIEKWNTEGIPYSIIANRLGYYRSTIIREMTHGIDSQGTYPSAHKRSVSRIRRRKLGNRKILKSKELQT